MRERYDAPYALSLNSGTSAIFAALAAFGVEPGDEVVVAGWTFLAAVTPLLWLGAVPVLADVAEGEPVADVDSIMAVVTPNTRAVVVTHLFGEPVDTSRIVQALAPLGIPVLEDCSHAHASIVDGAAPGSRADAAIFSVGARKIVSGGHGGVLITRDRAIYDTALMVAHTKPRTRLEFEGSTEAQYAELALGGNLRMSPLAATLALDHLARLDELAIARVENAEVLADALLPIAEPLRSSAPGENRTYFDVVFNLTHGESSAGIIEALAARGVPASTSPTRPLSRTISALSPLSSGRSGRYWRDLADWAPSVRPLVEAERLYDRSFRFPSELLYETGAPVARDFAATISGVLRKGGSWTR